MAILNKKQRQLKIVAVQPGGRYLVQVDDEKDVVKRMGCVVDYPIKTVYPPFFINSILARGYWEEGYEGPQIDEILEMVRESLA